MASRAISSLGSPRCTLFPVSLLSPLSPFSLALPHAVYTNLGRTHPLEWASTLLAFLAVLVAIPVYVFYWNGPAIRARSPFAQQLVGEEEEGEEDGVGGLVEAEARGGL